MPVIKASQQTLSNIVVYHYLVAENFALTKTLKFMPRHFQFWALLKAHLDCYLIAVSVNE